MTSNTDGAAQGEAWRKSPMGWNGGMVWSLSQGKDELDSDRFIGIIFETADVNAIIADHRKAQMADVLAKALEDLRDVQNGPPLARKSDVDAWEAAYALANAALAQFHAATEEVTP